MEIRPISLKDAQNYINEYHRHHSASIGHKFSISVWDGDRLCGVAMCGRPVSRQLDDGLTLEITRLCTDGTKNACSMLYGACRRAARAMGYKRVITYILESENGASLRARNFICDGVRGGLEWKGKRQENRDSIEQQSLFNDKKKTPPKELKKRYIMRF